jgi:multiple sugar transport system permease protein
MTSLSILQKSSKRKSAAHPYRSEVRAAWSFLLPSLLGVICFLLLPFAETVRRSFTDARGLRCTGLENYKSVIENSAFQLAVKNTARFICVCVPLLLAVSLMLALLVRAVRPGGKRFKTTFLLPMAIPVASIVFLWKVLFNSHGLINGLLVKAGAGPVDFMGTGAAFWVLVLTYLWKNSGYDMILWLAGLDGINPNYYEAAAVDGAGSFQMFWHITLPGLAPTLGLVAILSLLNTFKVFREAYLVAGKYPDESMYLLQHLFNNWFALADMGRLTAGAVLVAAALAGLLLLFLRLRRED